MICDTSSMKRPRNTTTPSISASNMTGGIEKPSAQLTRPELAPENASTWLKVIEPSMMVKSITETRIEPSSDFLTASHVRQRKAAARMRIEITPKPADSVG